MLTRTIPSLLVLGYIVDLGDFGRFRIKVKTTGAPTPEEVSSNLIQRVSVAFNVGPRLMQGLYQVDFEKLPQPNGAPNGSQNEEAPA